MAKKKNPSKSGLGKAEKSELERLKAENERLAALVEGQAGIIAGKNRAIDSLQEEMAGLDWADKFGKVIGEAQDLEQLLCHSMNWIMQETGYTNMAVFLAQEDNQMEVAAYVKYTIASSPEFIKELAERVIPQTPNDGVLHRHGRELPAADIKAPALNNQDILAIKCEYLGDPIAVVIAFRYGGNPFTRLDEIKMNAIRDTLGRALAASVYRGVGDLNW